MVENSDTHRSVFVNDLTYSDGQEDPLEALDTTLAFSVNDWGASRAMSWVWGIVCGWDNEDGTPGEAMAEQAQRHGWSDEAVARLRRLHAAFAALRAKD